MATLNFDAAKFEIEEEKDGFEPIPEGFYHAVAIDSELKETKAGTGSYLQFTFEIIDEGKWKGRWVWDRFNLSNPNPRAVEIAQENLAKFCSAAGLSKVSDSFELHHRPIKIKVMQRDWNGKTQNEIKGYRKPEIKDSAPSPVNASNVPF